MKYTFCVFGGENNMSVVEVVKKLRDYYEKYCKKLVFVGEKQLNANNNCKMYFLNVSEETELNNYKKLFQEYLFFYIRNRDRLCVHDTLINATSSEEISTSLKLEGNKIRNIKGLYPEINVNKSGIYGELFNDFYLNIVKQEEVMSTYSIRSSFLVPNVKGVDLIASTIEKENLTLIFSESKFVNSIYAASTSLCEDIVGNSSQIGHISKEYINEYMAFFINKNHSIYFNETNSNFIMEKINYLDFLIMNNNLKPIDAINEMNIKVRFDFFAIYNDSIYDIEQRKVYFERIMEQFHECVINTGIKNYDIEIVFIPTKNKAKKLKEAMELWD